jgi:hypothetical protein
MNSVGIQNDVNMDSLRYSRDDNRLIGYQDRYLFSLNSMQQRFLFMRPFDSNGTLNGEAKLLLWMKKKHEKLIDICEKQVLLDNYCLKSFLNRISFEDQLILIPIVSQNTISLAKNLECSFSRLGYTNVILLTFEHKVHGKKLFIKSKLR